MPRLGAVPEGDRRARTERGPAMHAVRVGLAVAVALLTYIVFPASPAVDMPLLEVGAVARDNVIAPFAFVVPKSAEELEREQAEIARSVPTIVAYDAAALDSSRAALARVRADLARAAGVQEPAQRLAAVASAASAQNIQLTQPEAAYLSDGARADAILSAVQRVLERWLPTGVAASGALDGEGGIVTLRRDGVERAVAADSLGTFGVLMARAQRVHPDAGSGPADAVYRKLLATLFRPTLALDGVATERARQELRRSISPNKYTVREGEKIVGAHEVVGAPEHEKMRAMRTALERPTERRSVGRVVGAVMFNLLVVAIFGATLLFFRPQLYASIRAVSVLAALFAFVVVVASVVAHAPETPVPELVPVAFAAVIVTVMFDARIGMIAAIILSVLVGGQFEYRGTNALFLNLIGGTAAAFSMRVVRRRDEAYYAMLGIAAAYLLGAAAIGLTLDRPPAEMLQSAGWGALNAVVSVSVAMLLVPQFEAAAGVDTYFKLLEWSDLNRPLLRRLSLEAPGTYAHTMAIANLAETACNAIGANGLLARVGAYYHDIGKVKKPQYFVENQPRGRNPHDKLKPATSAAIIRNHVTEGIELAEAHKLPRAVRAFITEHHGTGSISYFLEKAKERDGAAPSNTAEYAYPGPIPQTIETAVVMLADGVEAAARVVQEPSYERVREVIDRIVAMRMEQGQLRDAPLTLRDLETVKEQFARVLVGMHHGRVDYPASVGIRSEAVNA